MNWYKIAQFQNKMVTMEQIIQAMDQLIIEQGFLSSQDFQEALIEEPYYMSKAAYRTKTPKLKPDFSKITKKMERDALKLVNKGIFKATDISKTLNIPLEFAQEILKRNNIHKTEDRNTYYENRYMDKVNEMLERSSKSFDEGPTINDIAAKLGTSPQVIKAVTKKHNIDFLQLRTDRRKKIAKMVNSVILEQTKTGKTVNSRVIIQMFKKKTGYVLNDKALRRALAEIGKTSSGQQEEKSLFKFFTEYLWKTTYKGFKGLFDAFKNNPQGLIPELNIIIDRFFIQEGPSLFDEDYGHLNVANKGDAQKAKAIIYAKMQVQDFILGKMKDYPTPYPVQDRQLGKNLKDINAPIEDF